MKKIFVLVAALMVTVSAINAVSYTVNEPMMTILPYPNTGYVGSEPIYNPNTGTVENDFGGSSTGYNTGIVPPSYRRGPVMSTTVMPRTY